MIKRIGTTDTRTYLPSPSIAKYYIVVAATYTGGETYIRGGLGRRKWDETAEYCGL